MIQSDGGLRFPRSSFSPRSPSYWGTLEPTGSSYRPVQTYKLYIDCVCSMDPPSHIPTLSLLKCPNEEPQSISIRASLASVDWPL